MEDRLSQMMDQRVFCNKITLKLTVFAFVDGNSSLSPFAILYKNAVAYPSCNSIQYFSCVNLEVYFIYRGQERPLV